MSWWGKVVGGTFGFVVGGPLGALLGAALGHGFDKGGYGRIGNHDFGRADPQRIQTAFFTATFSVMGHLAKVDGRVSEDEIEAARAVMRRMDLTPQHKKTAIRLFTEGKRADFPLDDVLAQFKRECHRRRNLYRIFIEIQLSAAYADGGLHHQEKRLLLHMCERLGLSRFEFARLEAGVRTQRHTSRAGHSAAASSSLEDDYAALGVSRQASDSEVKKAYRRLINQHHPDKLVARGLPEEMMKVASQKTHEIKSAYDRIRNARGF